MTLRVYNTLTRQKEDFKPVTPGKVGMYVCGPTVYKPSHVGHMVGPVIFDTVKRYLQYLGYQVTLVVNITDIDDKIINEAARQKREWKELAESVTQDYLNNLKQLGVTGIDHFPRATEYVGEIQRIIQGLIDKGYAYASAGDVYFDVTRDADYGKLCNRDPEQLEAGARIEVSAKKRSPGDFALWKGAKPSEPKTAQWDSPWGPGRPGWHIECSAMSMQLLGQTLDIHGGGLDLQFPHHENELAQSESLTDKPFARYWMHNGLMKTGDQKMSKSAGNEIVVSEVLKRHSPETLRFLLLSTHYRSPIEYSEERLNELKRSLEGFQRFFERLERLAGRSFYSIEAVNKLDGSEGPPKPPIDEVIGVLARAQRFTDCMDDDFNTGGAVGVLHEALRSMNGLCERIERPEPYSHAADPPKQDHLIDQLVWCARVLRRMGGILGLFEFRQPRHYVLKADPGAYAVTGAGVEMRVGVSPERLRNLAIQFGCGDLTEVETKSPETLIQKLIDRRLQAKKEKNFALGDQIRDGLKQLGVTLEDRKGGTSWRIG